MTGTLRSRLAHGLSIVAAVTPFAFALIRAARTGKDFRYLWMALASVAGATVATKAAKGSGTSTVVMLTCVAATAGGVAAAVLTGTALGAPVLIVGAAFGCCFAAGALFRRFAGSQ